MIFVALIIAIYFRHLVYKYKPKIAKHLDLEISTVFIIHVAGYAYLFDSPILPWWDSFTHFLFPYYLVLLLNNLLFEDDKKRRFTIKPQYIQFIFLSSLAISLTVVWELFEFVIDQFANPTFRMQSDPNQTPLYDTMIDLSMDVLGATTAPLWILLKKRYKK